MAKLEQALILDPPTELHFEAPFTDTTTAYLKLTNPTNRPILFKLKTTAPKTYCVRPNSGTVKPSQTLSVAVMLQSVNFDGAEKNKHKFMVQSAFPPNDDIDALNSAFHEIWRAIPADHFMNSKLKCAFIDKPDSKPIGTDGFTDKDMRHEKLSTSEVPAEVHGSHHKEGHTDLDKLLTENKHLASLLAEMRQENSQLKEESLRSRVIRSGGATGESQSPAAQFAKSSSRPLEQESSMLGTKNIVIMFVVLIVGIYLGNTIF